MTDSHRQPSLPYQAALFLRLFAGTEKLDENIKNGTTKFFLSARCAGGGFHGRSGIESEGDLYYTSFALRGLALLGALDDESLLDEVCGFLIRRQDRIKTPADLFSFTFCFSVLAGLGRIDDYESKKLRLLKQWSDYHCPDGCYASSPNTRHSSTYTTFLAASAFEILDAENEKSVIDPSPILKRQRPDGGFVELEPLKHSGTNPTAAAIALLKMRGRQPKNRQGAVDFLLDRQTPEGGFQANTQIPAGDLLSSFTALVALLDLEAEDRCDPGSLRRFVTGLRNPEGGYHGAAWDRESDAEYTFYGLALESLLASIEPAA